MIKLKVIPDGLDEYEVTVGSRDVLLWERTTKGKSFSDLANGVAMGDMYRLAYYAAKRTGEFAGKETEFEATHEVDIAGRSEAPDPTP